MYVCDIHPKQKLYIYIFIYRGGGYYLIVGTEISNQIFNMHREHISEIFHLRKKLGTRKRLKILAQKKDDDERNIQN